jgi:transposase InsO family protein
MKGKHPLSVLCELLAVSRSGYYRWRESRPTKRQCDDARLADQIAAAHARSRKNYGAPRIVEELHDEGTPISKRRCARLMKARGLQGRKKHRRRPRTTDSRHAHVPAENLLAKQAAPTGPNQAWMTDITYIETGEGWLYLAAILDVWSRRVVGWACSPTLHVSLVLVALHAALRQRKPPKGLVHHSDRGVQYACHDYAAALAAAGIVCSMSRRGNCYDNAAMESFWSTLKTETGLDAAVPISRRAAELIVFDYIETFYNPTRRHSSLGYLSPVAFEKQPTKNDIKAA